jgi:hypothetical protein
LKITAIQKEVPQTSLKVNEHIVDSTYVRVITSASKIIHRKAVLIASQNFNTHLQKDFCCHPDSDIAVLLDYLSMKYMVVHCLVAASELVRNQNGLLSIISAI